MNIPLSCGVTAISVGSTHLAKALRQLPECHPFPTQAVQLPYRQGEPLPPRNNSIAFQDVLRLICVLAPHASTSMPNVQQMPALQSHSWCHLKKDGRLHLRYHHTTTLNKDHDELKTSRALISVLSEQPDNVRAFPTYAHQQHFHQRSSSDQRQHLCQRSGKLFFPPAIGQRADL